MKYISVSEFSQRHKIPERTVRNYCATGRIQGTFLTGKTWNIPEDGMIGEKRGILQGLAGGGGEFRNT